MPRGLLLPALPIAGFDRAQGTIDLFVSVDPAAHGLASLLALRDGQSATLAGPLGRGFEVDPRSRYLLIVTDISGLARVRAVVDEAIASGRQVTLLYGASSASEVFPSTLLRDEAEYVVATADGSLGYHGAVTDLVRDYEAWADQCFVAGSSTLLSRMAALAKGRDERMGVARLGRRRARRRSPSAALAMRRSWLQVALPHAAGCALGVCLGCATPGAKGPLRVCREGPAFAVDELRWEPAP
ncbi:MAG: hypothetical protein ACC726_09645 [Chloroflexota bacterium]